VNSLRAIHPDMPVHVHTFAGNATLLDKAQMLDISPFDETLFLDADTVVLDRLDFGFEQAQRFGLACCICECPWARRFAGISGDLIEYNTGVLFFTKAVKPLFDAWKYWCASVDSSMEGCDNHGNARRWPVNDQAGFAKAIVETGFNPAVLPLNWNFRPKWQHTFFGPLKIWHDYTEPSAGLYQVAQLQSGEQKMIDHFTLK